LLAHKIRVLNEMQTSLNLIIYTSDLCTKTTKFHITGSNKLKQISANTLSRRKM